MVFSTRWSKTLEMRIISCLRVQRYLQKEVGQLKHYTSSNIITQLPASKRKWFFRIPFMLVSCAGSEVFVNTQVVQKLSEGLMSHYLPELQRSKHALQELTQNQAILLDTLEQEIAKFRDCNSMIDLNSLFTEAKVYHSKLVNIRKEMITLHERTSKLKKRALKLQQQRQKEALEREQQRERELERERQLTAKPAKRT